MARRRSGAKRPSVRCAGGRANDEGQAGGDEPEKRARPEKPKAAATASRLEDDPDARVVKIPLPLGFEVEIKVPRNLTVADLRRMLCGLLPYASDWDPNESPRQTFLQLGGARDDLHARE